MASRARLFHGRGPLAFDADAAAAQLAAADRKLGRLIGKVGPVRLGRDLSDSPFASLAAAIVHQQLTGHAAATILARLRAIAPPAGRLTPDDVLAASDERLRAVGLSRGKTAALRDLAAKALDGTVPGWAKLSRMDDEEIIERLTAVRGVGRWTVEMLLIFRLGRPDVLPVHDYGVRKGFRLTFGGDLPAPADVAERGERWRPFRSIASWYLWRALELPAAEARLKRAEK